MSHSLESLDLREPTIHHITTAPTSLSAEYKRPAQPSCHLQLLRTITYNAHYFPKTVFLLSKSNTDHYILPQSTMIPRRASPFLLLTIFLSSLIVLSTGLPTDLASRENACTALGHCPGQHPKPEPLPANSQHPRLPNGPQHEGTKTLAPHSGIQPRDVSGDDDGGKPKPSLEPKPIGNPGNPKHGHLKTAPEPAEKKKPAQANPHGAAPSTPA